MTNFKPRIKQIALKYHHFKDQIAHGFLRIPKGATDIIKQNWHFHKAISQIQV
jgi:hypothetical protein